MKLMRNVYADNAATTRVSETALQAMLPYLRETYGNPSSLHTAGQKAAAGLAKARQIMARGLNGQPREIYFTSGGTEADNWAITFAARRGAKSGKKHLITSAFEHHAVLHTMEALEKEGFEVTYLPVYSDGLVRTSDVAGAIRPDTALVSIMYANNEIGTIQPIAEIGAVCREKGVLFHTDAVQAAGRLPIDVKAQNIDMLSLSGHKFHGPKGVGLLYCRQGLPIQSLLQGGAQERGKRPGTENVASIAAMAAAFEESLSKMAETSTRIQAMRDKLIESLSKIPKSRLNGDPIQRLPGNVNFCFEGIEGESLLLSLDLQGIAGSSGSACTSGSLDPSHVLLAIGLPHEIAHGSLRLSLSEDNTMEDVDYILQVLPPIVERLRDMSPVWERMMNEEKKEA